MKTIEMLETSEVSRFPDRNLDDRLRTYLEETVTRETREGLVEYQLLCGAMETDNGDGILVRKALYEDSAKPIDWLVVTWKSGEEPVEQVVLAARTTENDEGDTIELEFAPEVENRGNSILQFGVDTLYQPTNQPISVSHRKYYGRGFGPEPELQLDTLYDKSCLRTEEIAPGHLAEVIELDAYRRDVGRTAVVNG